MLIRIEGKEKTIEDLERAIELMKEAQNIIYRLPTGMKVIVEGEESVNCSQDTR